MVVQSITDAMRSMSTRSEPSSTGRSSRDRKYTFAPLASQPELPGGVLFHWRDFSGAIIGSMLRGEELGDSDVRLPSMGYMVDDYFMSHGYMENVITATYEAYTLNNDWPAFRDVMLTHGMAEQVAWFIHKWTDSEHFGFQYSRANYCD
ncbi:hypothetical protein EW026_g2834 [Hermanssonia centrifuga]|uniref:Uncharacterized protein n=1 Tax=Hermanssonia centrifuga TaxID=98765 RepID=A0A4V3XAV0_9APHY|nr:hypothetical protein EW026_g2834 [Hermanssonia centrifuga]